MNERNHADAVTSPGAAIQDAWWGEYPLDVGTWGHWRIGPLDLWAGRNRHDWEIAFVRNGDPSQDESRVEVPADLERLPVPPDTEQRRVGYATTPEILELLPVLADRAIVTRPESSFSIPSQEKVSVFVSSAVWVRLSLGPQKERVLELPSWRGTDTWFGNNLSGHLCYATRSSMRLEIDDLPPQPHRVVTRILIDNQGLDTLNIERISLPIPNLSVFASPAGALRTEELHLTRTKDTELARVHIERDCPPVPGAVRLSGPRRVAEDGLMSRVFTGLFG